MDQVSSWMVQAAQTVDSDVMKAATATSTPELSAPWYQQEFGYLAFFGAALAGIVATLGVLSASCARRPVRAGRDLLRDPPGGAGHRDGGVADPAGAEGRRRDLAVTSPQHMPAQFFGTLSSAWGTKGWGGLASSALAFVAALVEVVIAVLLWVELLFRDAAIYVAVLFFPFTLAVAIWPRLSGANSKLARILAVFIAFKPAALIVMMTGANLLLGGLSFYGGLAPSAGHHSDRVGGVGDGGVRAVGADAPGRARRRRDGLLGESPTRRWRRRRSRRGRWPGWRARGRAVRRGDRLWRGRRGGSRQRTRRRTPVWSDWRRRDQLARREWFRRRHGKWWWAADPARPGRGGCGVAAGGVADGPKRRRQGPGARRPRRGAGTYRRWSRGDEAAGCQQRGEQRRPLARRGRSTPAAPGCSRRVRQRRDTDARRRRARRARGQRRGQ